MKRSSPLDPDSPSSDTTLSIVTDGSELESLRSAWNDLVLSDSKYSIFSTWEWSYCWWLHYAEPTDELHVVVLNVSGRCRGIAPFYLRHGRSNHPAGSAVYLLGTGGEEWDEVTSVYLDLIVSAEYQESFIDLLVDHFKRNPTWERIELLDLDPESTLSTGLVPCLEANGLPSVTRQSSFSFPIYLEDRFDKYLSRLSKNRRKAIRQNRVRFDNAGELEISKLAKVREVDHFLETLRDLHLSKHHSDLGESAFESDRFVEFHRNLLALLVPMEWVDLRILRLDGRAISALYNYSFGNRIYSYQSGHRYEQWSPGLLADSIAIAEACEQGLECYDLLKGDPGTFKDSLDAEQRQLVSMKVFASRPKAFVQNMVEKLRRIKDLVLARRVSMGRFARVGR